MLEKSSGLGDIVEILDYFVLVISFGLRFCDLIIFFSAHNSICHRGLRRFRWISSYVWWWQSQSLLQHLLLTTIEKRFAKVWPEKILKVGVIMDGCFEQRCVIPPILFIRYAFPFNYPSPTRFTKCTWYQHWLYCVSEWSIFIPSLHCSPLWDRPSSEPGGRECHMRPTTQTYTR